MHFHCTQCRHQFCSGCYNAFYAKNVSPESWGRDGRVGGAIGFESQRLLRSGPGEEKRSTGCKAQLSIPLPFACSSNVSISPHPYTPHAGVPERPGPQQSPTSSLPSGFLPEMSRA